MQSMGKYKQPHHLLFIEDDPDQWSIIKFILKETLPEQKCLCVTGYREFSELLNEDRNLLSHSLIILDLYLPDKAQGLQILHELKKPDSHFRHIPTIILSHSGAAEDVTEAYNRGCSSYHVKPVEMEQWLHLFAHIKRFWLDTAFIPQRRYIWSGD